MTRPPTLVEELSPAPDPVESCERFRGLPYLLFLDSATDPVRLGRYSFLAADPALLVRSKEYRCEVVSVGSREVRSQPKDAIGATRDLLALHRTDPIAGLPPFQGGVAGYIAYDWGAVLERLPSPRYDDLAIPDVMLGLYDWVIAWDHVVRRAWVVSTGLPESGDAAGWRAAERLTMVKCRLSATVITTGGTAWRPTPERVKGDRAPSYPLSGVNGGSVGLRTSFTHRDYLAAVSRVRDYILAGDIFQANLSQRLEAPLREPVWSLYQSLRRINPAPFAAYLEFGEFIVASASPERFLSLSDTRHVEARPIKGTRPRGSGPEHDAALGRALRESEKDVAENLMIVDLLRNDLSRVCLPGTVHTPELFALEHYSTVHHLVSTVVGELDPGADAGDLLRAAFPGGSITGAPKVRAMEIIAELEPSRRGIYCGAIGYWSLTGAFDTSIVIRTYLAIGDRVYFSVGGGIVADSDPEQEFQETLDKAKALIEALEAGSGQWAVGNRDT